MARVLWMGLTGLLLAYAAAATAVMAFDDHRYHTILFAPVPDRNWHVRQEAQSPPCGKVKKAPCLEVSFNYPDCTRFNPIQCWIYPNTGLSADAVEYHDGDLTVEVHAADLGLPGHDREKARHDLAVAPLTMHDSLPGQVLIALTVTARNRPPQVDARRVVLTAPCGPGVVGKTSGAFAVKVEPFLSFTISDLTGIVENDPPEKFQANIAFAADRAQLKTCTLRLGDAIQAPTGRRVPDVTFLAVRAAHYDELPSN